MLKLAVSNIGWNAEQDEEAYALMKKYQFTGLEIAPTRIFPEKPYERLEEAALWSRNLAKKHGFTVTSLQSIWFGRQERLFGTEEEREVLAEYTRQAIDFSSAVGSRNLVFGCPRNRVCPDGTDPEAGLRFFAEIGNYAAQRGTVIGMEANPAIYNTNYINSTSEALDLIRAVGSRGFLLNLDVGTMIQNEEDPAGLEGNVNLINHVHISEPGLKPIEQREIHQDLKRILTDGSYEGFVSIEMGKVEELSVIEEARRDVRSVFQ